MGILARHWRPKMGEIAKISYTHDAMIDLIVANPLIRQMDLAKYFGYTPGWICQIMQSDAFQERLAARKKELVAPVVTQSIEERFKGLVARGQEILQEKLDGPNPPTELALKVVEAGARALGYGAKAQGATVNVGFVVAMPEKAQDAKDWIQKHSPQTIEAPATRQER